MSETTTQTEQAQATETNQPQDNFAAIANAMWNDAPVVPQQQQPAQQQAPAAATEAPAAEAQEEVLDINEWIKREIGVDSVDAFKNEWGELRKLKEQPPKPQEHEWANEESKKFFEYLKGDKRDEVRRILNQQAELEKLEKYEITDVAQASEIIKANLQHKYKDLDAKQIERLYTRQYSLPSEPRQGMDQNDEDYAQDVAEWKRQVQEKEQDIIIDARIAKPELANYKSQIVLPDIPNNATTQQQQGPSQEDLAAQQAMQGFVQKLGTDYRNFKGYSTIAKDGEVELPINYGLNDDEKLSFNPTVQKAIGDINTFLDNDLGWWDKASNSFNVNKIQEDLYLLLNKEKVLSKMAGEAAAQRFQHHLKVSNNIKLEGVNTQTTIPVSGQGLDAKAKNQQLAESVWSI